MHSLTKLTLLFYFSIVFFGNYVSSQTVTTSLYVPTVSDASLGNGTFLLGSLVGAQDGTSTYELILGSTSAGGPSPSLTLVEASTTAHLLGSAAVDDQGDNLIINVQCTINGGLSTCEANSGGAILSPGVTAPISTITFTETVISVPVTLVATLPSTTSNLIQPSSPSSSESSNTALSQTTPEPTSSTTSNGTTSSTASPGPPPSSSTNASPNTAIYHNTVSFLLCTLPIVAVSILL